MSQRLSVLFRMPRRGPCAVAAPVAVHWASQRSWLPHGPSLSRMPARHLAAVARPPLLPEFSLKDHVVVVSGGARGLGLVQAEALLEAGALGRPSFLTRFGRVGRKMGAKE